MPNVSHKNHLIFMPMTVQVTYIFIPIVSLKDSFCHGGKSKLGIGLFIHELLREPLICTPFSALLRSQLTERLDEAETPRKFEISSPLSPILLGEGVDVHRVIGREYPGIFRRLSSLATVSTSPAVVMETLHS